MSTAESKISPPASLYKYLAPERITDVLETATFKFTRMANTNDIFEVRKTFERIAGPRFKELMLTKYSQIISKKNIEDRFLEKLEHILFNPGHIQQP
ncbi:hypothetical protein [Neorhizobium sp. T6_25]|uniref:hypothetical protein n=1 Tax=Neorhizobium sp. T6_25 TaxID=2093833 RepID=UPI00155E9B9A|nr:hypothetical protein [Neorhizobium sp. T6_25]